MIVFVLVAALLSPPAPLWGIMVRIGAVTTRIRKGGAMADTPAADLLTELPDLSRLSLSELRCVHSPDLAAAIGQTLERARRRVDADETQGQVG